MKICATCGSSMPDNAEYCDVCGSDEFLSEYGQPQQNESYGQFDQGYQDNYAAGTQQYGYDPYQNGYAPQQPYPYQPPYQQPVPYQNGYAPQQQYPPQQPYQNGYAPQEPYPPQPYQQPYQPQQPYMQPPYQPQYQQPPYQEQQPQYEQPQPQYEQPQPPYEEEQPPVQEIVDEPEQPPVTEEAPPAVEEVQEAPAEQPETPAEQPPEEPPVPEEPEEPEEPKENPYEVSKNFKFEKKESAPVEDSSPKEKPKGIKGFLDVITNTRDHSLEFDKNDAAANQKMAILACFGVTFWTPFVFRQDSRFSRFYGNQGLLILIAMIPCTLLFSLFAALLVGTACVDPAPPHFLTIGGWIADLILFAICYSVPIFMIVCCIKNIKAGKAKDIPFIGRLRLIS